MPDLAPLVLLTTLEGEQVYVHLAHIVKITPADREAGEDSNPRPESGSVLTIATGTGTANLEVKEYLLHSGQAAQQGFLFLTDLDGRPIKINAAYVLLARAQGSGTMLEVCSSAGAEQINVQDSLATVSDWWAEYAPARLRA